MRRAIGATQVGAGIVVALFSLAVAGLYLLGVGFSAAARPYQVGEQRARAIVACEHHLPANSHLERCVDGRIAASSGGAPTQPLWLALAGLGAATLLVVSGMRRQGLMDRSVPSRFAIRSASSGE